MRKKHTYLVVGTYLLIAGFSFAQDTVYPTGTNIESQYALSSTSLLIGDTLFIERTLINSSTTPLTGLYFSDHFPSSFQPVQHSCLLNGSPIQTLAEGPFWAGVVPGYSSYYWIVDSPNSSEDINQTINAGDTLVLTVGLQTQGVGTFTFPLRTISLMKGSSGSYATGPAFDVAVTVTSGVEDLDTYAHPSEYTLTARAYPNPFNPEVTIFYEGRGLAGQTVRFEMFNVLGQQIHDQVVVAEAGSNQVVWRNPGHVGSGVYLYKLSTESATAVGKLVLAK